ncbi:MAG TPA: single-stranded DNA-binding protein, partial [Actinomycetes bacterium]
MNETTMTLIGNVATEIRSARSREGVAIASFRVASTTRRFERGKGWTDVDITASQLPLRSALSGDFRDPRPV